MNILFFCQLYPPAIYGGGEYIFFQYAKELAKRGHIVFTIAQKLPETKEYEQLQGINVYRTGRTINFNGALPVSVTNNFDYLLKSIAKGLSILSKNKIDVIHSNTYIPAIAGAFCANIYKKPHIVTFHDVFYLNREKFWANWGAQSSSNRLVSVIGPLVERLSLNLPKTIYHTISEASKDDLTCSRVKKVVVIPNGIDIAEFQCSEQAKPQNFQVVFIGRLVFYKNIDTIIKSFKKIVSKFPEAKLIIIGDGPMRLPWNNLAKNLGLSKNVVFTGRVSDDVKVRIIKNSSFMILPSVVEGFGIVILEAFKYNKPVIVSDVKPLTELVKDGKNGYVVSAFDVDDWAKKITELFEDPLKAAEMGAYGRRLLEQTYTISKVTDQVERLYQQVAQ